MGFLREEWVGTPFFAEIPSVWETSGGATGGSGQASSGCLEVVGRVLPRLFCCLFIQYDALMSIDLIAFTIPVAIAVWLSQSRSAGLRRWACLFGLLGMPYWLYASGMANQWEMFALLLVCALGWVKGFWVHWLAPRRREAMDSGLGTIQITPGTR